MIHVCKKCLEKFTEACGNLKRLLGDCPIRVVATLTVCPSGVAVSISLCFSLYFHFPFPPQHRRMAFLSTLNLFISWLFFNIVLLLLYGLYCFIASVYHRVSVRACVTRFFIVLAPSNPLRLRSD